MSCRHGVNSAAFAILTASLLATSALAQGVGGRGTPWRGAGVPPCFGSDGGAFQCPPPPQSIAIRAGRMFDSKSGQMLTKQVVILTGDHITEVGPEAPGEDSRRSAGHRSSQATVLPASSMRIPTCSTPRARHVAKTSTLIAVQNLQNDLRAGFTSARDMSSHGNGYGDVAIRNAINEGRIEGRATGSPAAASSGAPSRNRPAEIRSPKRGAHCRGSPRGGARAYRAWRRPDQAVPAGAYSFSPTGEAQYVLTYPIRCWKR